MFHEYIFTYTNEYYTLKKLYEMVDSCIHKYPTLSKKSGIVINLNDILLKFNIFNGDITSGIKWTWCSNNATLHYFSSFLQSININKQFKLFSKSNSEFDIKGASFITLNTDTVTNAQFHYDIMSQYDTDDTNIITILFPLYSFDKSMGNLEYNITNGSNEVEVYKYKTNALIMWDSCKFLHRTQPYKLSHPKKRILVSINLSTDEPWAISIVDKCLKSQGNLL